MTRKRPRKAEAPKDFPKKKQKVGKGKRPAENETTITFKSGSVVIPSQLERSAGPTTHRKLSLQTLLDQLGHYKSSVRREALTGIRELLQTHIEIFDSNFSKILLKIFPLIVDDNALVRQVFCSLLKYMFSRTSVDNLRPFIAIVVAHLICGMTHINEEIKYDSLKIFDLVLSHFPSLLIPHAFELLPLFVRLISRLKERAESSIGGKKSLLTTIQKSLSAKDGSGSALASNPNSRMAVQESRMTIFSQILTFIDVILDSRALSCDAEASVMTPPIIDMEKRRVFVPVGEMLIETNSALCDFASAIPQVVVLKHHGALPSEEAYLPPEKKQGGRVNKSTHLFPDHKQFFEFVNSLFLLLLESWVECDPSRVFDVDRSTQGAKKKNQALPFMETILNTMCSLLRLVDQSDRRRQADEFTLDDSTGINDQTPVITSLNEQLRQKYWSDIKTHAISHFPFSSSVFKLPAASPDGSSQFLTMDFLLSYATLLLHSCPTNRTALDVSYATELVCKFLAHLNDGGLATNASTTPNALQTFVALFPLYTRLCESCDIPRERQVEAMKSVWSMYTASHPLSSARQLLVKCFNHLLKEAIEKQSNGEIRSLVFSELLFPWIQDLPNQLVSLGESSPKTSGLVISSISLATMHNHPGMEQALMTTVQSIFTTESVLHQLPTPVQRKAVELFWHLPLSSLTQGILSKLAAYINSLRCDDSTLKYLIQVVHYKFFYHPSTNPQISAPPYLSFILSMVVGYSSTDIEKFQVEELTSITVAKPKEGLNTSARVQIIECACRCLQSSPLSSTVLKLLEKALLNILSEPKLLPFDTALGILKLIQTSLSSSGEILCHDLISCFGQLCLATLVAMEELHPQIPLPLSMLHPLLPECSTVMETLLKESESILKSLLLQFQNKTVGYDMEKLVVVLVRLLKRPGLASSLRKQREDVLTAVLQFSGVSTHKTELDIIVSQFHY